MFRQIKGAIPHDIQGGKENKKQLPSQHSLQENKGTKSTEIFLGDFRFLPGVLEPDTREK
jgi:hypothetical protein